MRAMRTENVFYFIQSEVSVIIGNYSKVCNMYANCFCVPIYGLWLTLKKGVVRLAEACSQNRLVLALTASV